MNNEQITKAKVSAVSAIKAPMDMQVYQKNGKTWVKVSLPGDRISGVELKRLEEFLSPDLRIKEIRNSNIVTRCLHIIIVKADGNERT
jgi:hypothetical protein